MANNEEFAFDPDNPLVPARLISLLDLFDSAPDPGKGLTFEIYEICRSCNIEIPQKVMSRLLIFLDGYARTYREDHPPEYHHPKDHFPEYMMVEKLHYWACKRKSKPPGKWEDYFQGIPIEDLEEFFARPSPSQNDAIDLVEDNIAPPKDPTNFRRNYFKWKRNHKIM